MQCIHLKPIWQIVTVQQFIYCAEKWVWDPRVLGEYYGSLNMFCLTSCFCDVRLVMYSLSCPDIMQWNCFYNLFPSYSRYLPSLCRRGDQRRVSVYKTKKAVGMKVKENLTHFTFSEESKDVLQEIFMRYPPGGEMDHNMAGEHNEHTDKLRGKRDNIFCKPSMSRSEISKKMESLASRIEKNQNLRQVSSYFYFLLIFCLNVFLTEYYVNNKFQIWCQQNFSSVTIVTTICFQKMVQITEGRAKLPIASFQDVITSTIGSHQVLLTLLFRTHCVA